MKTIARAGALLALSSVGCGGDDAAVTAPDDAAIDSASATDASGSDAFDATDARADASSDVASDTAEPSDGAPPPGFWDTDPIPKAKNVMMFRFLNRTNGKLSDAEIFWRFSNATTTELHSLAEMGTYDMPINASGRLYFYLCPASDPTAGCGTDPTKSKYFDFIEHTIGAAQYNGNTTRVDAFGIKLAIRLHCEDGYDVAVGEDYATFLQDRPATFDAFRAEVPVDFQGLAAPPYAPYRIVEPGALDFKTGGAHAHDYDAFVDTMWAKNGLTITKPGPNGSGLGAYPDVSAAIFRHVGDVAGSFSPDGKLLNKTLWADATKFYTAAPANYYARFWHTHGLGGKAYGFPYDDVGSYSSYVSHTNPQYLLVAIGW